MVLGMGTQGGSWTGSTGIYRGGPRTWLYEVSGVSWTRSTGLDLPQVDLMSFGVE